MDNIFPYIIFYIPIFGQLNKNRTKIKSIIYYEERYHFNEPHG